MLRIGREGGGGRRRCRMLRVTTAAGSASAVGAGPVVRDAAMAGYASVIEELAHVRYAGRRVGTPGGRAAAR